MGDLLQRLSEEERGPARETAMPDWMDPMLAKLTHEHFTGKDWIFERKLDGERVITYVDPDGTVRLMSRNKNRLNDTYPEIEEVLADQAPTGCILDGEVVAFDENNVSDFQKLQPRMQASSREESKAIGFGALLLGLYRDGDLVYAGKVGTGFDDETLQNVRGRLDEIERKTSPYDQGDPETDEVHFVTPKLVCEVRFTEWTEDDKLRHPRYKGLRRDKDPEDVHKEAESQRADL